jgi:2-polyprenyl-3-methyl-5-hydroxy-6-metoxy-1,4-benzoquinol methylase
MKLRNEQARSYIDDIKQAGLLEFLTWKGKDVAAAWIGAYEPATRSDDAQMITLARFSRDHYLFYRTLVEHHVSKEGTILDVGCGSGHRTAMLSRYATKVLAIDSDITKLGMGSSLNHHANIEWLFGDFLEWAKVNEQMFDHVFAVEVIEHVELEKQEEFMRELFRKVAPGGSLLMTTPKDVKPNRVHPHVGLWDDEIAKRLVAGIGGRLEYFNVAPLASGGDDPRCGVDKATHYVVVASK